MPASVRRDNAQRGERILSGSPDGTLKVWDAAKEQEPFTLTGHVALISSVCFSPDGKRFLSGSMDNTVIAWDARLNDDP